MPIQDQYPLAAPTVANNAITIALMLDQPTRITRYLSELPLQNFFAADVFSSGAAVTGGAVIYDQLTFNDLYLDAGRGVQDVEPGTEFPIVTHSITAPGVAPVVKTGGKFFVTDEARDRNDESSFQRKSRKLMNNLIRDLNTKALTALDASIAANSATQSVAGVSWGTFTTTAQSSKTDASAPVNDMTKVQLAADVAELGVDVDTLILHPNQAAVLKTSYGAANVNSVLSGVGIQNLIVSARVTAGTAYVLEAGEVGELRFEKGMSTETWREPETQRTWVQTDVREVMVVTNPFSVFKLTGIA